MYGLAWSLLAGMPLLWAGEPEAGSPETASSAAHKALPPATVSAGAAGSRREPLMVGDTGSIGLFHTTLPDAGDPMTFRVRAFTDFFVREAFIYDSDLGPDQHARVRGGFAVSFSPATWAEVFMAVRGSASRNERSQPRRQEPAVLHTLGDVDLGAKGLYRFDEHGIALGGQLGLGLLSGSQRLLASQVNFWVDALFAVDVRYLTRSQFPFRFTTNVGWILDNSLRVTDYASVTDAISREVVRFSMGGNHNRVRMRYAVDFPVRLGKQRQFGLDPILEWSWDIATTRQPAFEVASARTPRLPRSSQWLTVGLRANPVAGLMLDAAVDVGLVSPGFDYGPPVPPWQVMFAVGWSFDPKPVVREVQIEKASAAPPPVLERRIVGKVVDHEGRPVPQARIAFPGLPLSQLLTDESGGFTSYRFPAGTLTLSVLVGDEVVYEGRVRVGAERDTTLTIELDEPPAPATGVVQATFTDPQGKPVAARVHAVGEGIDQTFTSDAAGALTLELLAGRYTATLDAEGYEPKTIELEVPANAELEVHETLEPPEPKKPAPAATPNIRVRGQTIRLAKPLRYDGHGLSPRSHAILDELAAFLKANPDLEVLEIGVHTDDRGAAQRRSEERAAAVRSYLIGKGIPAERLRARGYGPSRPVAVNLTAAGRAQNNRTIITIVERSAP